MQATFNSMSYDHGLYIPGMNDFGADFGISGMFRDDFRDNSFAEANDPFMDMDFESMLNGKQFDSSNNDDLASVGHF